MGKEHYEVLLVNVTFGNRFQLITDGKIDVLAASSTYTMDRNVFDVSSTIADARDGYCLLCFALQVLNRLFALCPDSIPSKKA